MRFRIFLSPSRQCILCSSQFYGNVDLCSYCYGDVLKKLHPKHIRLHGFTDVIALFPYEFPFDALLHRFKFKSDKVAGEVLVFLLHKALEALYKSGKFQLHLYDNSKALTCISVPITPSLYISRGFNQSQWFLQVLIKFFNNKNIRFSVANPIKRVRSIEQVGLSAKKRYENMQNSYILVKRYIDKNQTVDQQIQLDWMIVDDVLTTGATLTDISKALKKIQMNRVNKLQTKFYALVMFSNHSGTSITVSK